MKQFSISLAWITFFLFNDMLLFAQQHSASFMQRWLVEDESRALQVIERADTLELIVPEGLTMWYQHPNQWYQIRIRVEKNRTTYSMNGEELFRYSLVDGEGDGHFGLRLLQNHVLFTGFKVTIL